MKVRWIFLLMMVSLLAAGLRMPEGFDSNVTAAPAETVTTVPLYRLYKEKYGFHFYTTSVADKDEAIQQNGYRDDGIAGYVLPKKAHGSVPLYHLSSVAMGLNRKFERIPVSDKHFYSTDKKEIDSAVAAGWKLETVVGYVAPPSNPMYGTTQFYRLYNPLGQYEEHHAYFDPGDDDNFYTTDFKEKERAIAKQGYQAIGVTAYIWTAPAAVALNAPASMMPDLVVEKSSVEGTIVTAVIRNQGKHNISSQPGIDVMFLILERNGKQVFSTVKTLKGMSPGQAQEVSFDTLNHNQVARDYQIKVDHLNKVSESNEGNNSTNPTPLIRIKIKNDPSNAAKLRPPSIAITDVRDVPPKFGQPHKAYRITVSNWEQYPAEQFQSTKGMLASNQCGDTRMQARITIYQGGRFFKGDCKPLNSPQDLRTLDTVSTVLGDADEISVTLVDRLTKESLPSPRFSVGWFGVGDLLTTVGCKYFLGRASSYLCSSDKGFAACENLRKGGKPIECRRSGKAE